MKIRCTAVVAAAFTLCSLAAINAATITEKWTRDHVPSQASAEFRAIATDAAGDIFILLTDYNSAGNRIYTAKYSGSDGHVIWEKYLDAAFQAHGLALDPQGNPAITARSSGISGHPSDVLDVYTVKYAGSNGAVLWEKRLNKGFNDAPWDVTTNQAGDVIVTGTASTANGTNDVLTICYAAADGQVRWERLVNGAANSYDEGHAVAVDAAGDVFVTGTISYTASTGEDVYVGKYSGVDGHVLWQTEKTLLSGYDSGLFLKIDPDGNPVVLAESPGPGGHRNSITTKYNGATGALIWTQPYDGTAHGNDFPQGLAIDAAGDVFVIIDSAGVGANGTETESDYYTAKYSAADGALLWEKRRDSNVGPPPPVDRPRGIQLDQAGNPVVTGQVAVTNTTYQPYTVCYQNSDGEVLWEKQEKRYPHGGISGETDPLALTPDGGVVINILVPGKLVTIKYLVTGATIGANGLWVAGRDLLANEKPNNAAEANATNAKVPQWSYGYRSVAASTALTLFAAPQHVNDPSGLEGWIAAGQATLGVNTKTTPIIFNTGSGDYKPLLPQQLYLSPGSGNEFLVARWTAPEAGDYRVLARWVDLDNHGGNGAIAQLIKNGSETFNCIDGKPCSYAEVFQSKATGFGRAWMRARTLRFNAGETLDFVLGSLGDHSFDATAFNTTIRRVPKVAITSPASGSELTGDVTFTIDVQHNQPIASVYLFFDDQTAGIGNPNNPYSIKASVRPGYHKVRAVATDADGAQAESPEISIFIKQPAAAQSATRTPASPEQTHFFRLCRTVKSGNWNDSTTWLNGITPQDFDDALIESGHHVVIDFPSSPRDLIIDGTLSGGGIDVKRTVYLNGTVISLNELVISTSGKLIVGRTGAAIKFSKVANYGRFVINSTDFDGEGSTISNLGTIKVSPPLASQGPLLVPLSSLDHKGGLISLAPNTTLQVPAGIKLNGLVELSKGWAPAISENGAGVVSNHGGHLISDNGAALIGNAGGTLVGDAGSGFLSEHGGALIGNAGGTFIGPDGARLIGNAGGTFVGKIQSPGSPTAASATTQSPAADILLTGGTITGTGELRGDVINEGAFIAPGNSAGGIVVSGNYTQQANGSLVLELGGKTFYNSFSYDVFEVAGTANLGGNLVVKTINGYTPAAGDTVPALLYGSHTGNFASISSNAQVSLGANGAQVTTNGTNPPAPKALNIATRMKVETGDNALIAGFIITGNAPKKVIVRGIGPSLPFGGVLADPTLSLDNGAVTNDNWRTNQEQEIIATTIPPSNNLESAIVATLNSGPHTVILRGSGNATGIGVVEVYDLESGSPVQLANISSRGFVQSGDNVMIGGFIIGGTYPTKIIVRAIGPSLPFPGILADPTLELVDQNGGRISNDNWRDAQEAEIIATTIPPTNDNESAIVATLAPGAYTAIVRGVDDTTGIAVVEAYNLQ